MEELHDDERDSSVRDAAISNITNIFVTNTTSGESFSLEPFLRTWRDREHGRIEKFDRHLTLDSGVESVVDHAHGTAAYLLPEHIAAGDRVARLWYSPFRQSHRILVTLHGQPSTRLITLQCEREGGREGL